MRQTKLLNSKLLIALVLIITGFISACSGSSSPSVNSNLNGLAENSSNDLPTDNDILTAPNPIASDPASDTEIDEQIEIIDEQAETDETPLTQTDIGNAENTNSPSDQISTAVPDPMVRNETEVKFEVTVPAYQSNELQLRLGWGEFSTDFNWIGDELWTTSAKLPTNIEHTLSIIFYDENGGIELAIYEQPYLTGSNAAEDYKITVDQLNTSQLDTDSDGISNLEELIAGTDPRVDEESLLDIVDFKNMGLLFIANYFERGLPKERPSMISEIEEVSVSHRIYNYLTVDVDGLGNGDMSMTELNGVDRQGRRASRTVSDNSVGWDGTWTYYDGDYSLYQEFTSEVSVDGATRRLVEKTDGTWGGTYRDSWENTVDITGRLIDGSEYCEPVSGTITEIHRNNRGGGNVNTLTITREAGDDFWRVLEVRESSTATTTSEYFTRELKMHRIRFGYQTQFSDNDHFFCDFVDL